MPMPHEDPTDLHAFDPRPDEQFITYEPEAIAVMGGVLPLLRDAAGALRGRARTRGHKLGPIHAMWEHDRMLRVWAVETLDPDYKPLPGIPVGDCILCHKPIKPYDMDAGVFGDLWQDLGFGKCHVFCIKDSSFIKT